MAGYSIGEFARRAGVPTTTVRYYERRELLHPSARVGSGNYRSYGEDQLEQLRFIRAAQATGFVLDDIATLLGLRDGATEPCPDVQRLIEDRLEDVAGRLADLKRVAAVLETSLRLCREQEESGRCEVINTLSGASTAKTRSRRT